MSVFGKFSICIFTLFWWGFGVTRNYGLESSGGEGFTPYYAVITWGYAVIAWGFRVVVLCNTVDYCYILLLYY